jgi:hypothetical protein
MARRKKHTATGRVYSRRYVAKSHNDGRIVSKELLVGENSELRILIVPGVDVPPVGDVELVWYTGDEVEPTK